MQQDQHQERSREEQAGSGNTRKHIPKTNLEIQTLNDRRSMIDGLYLSYRRFDILVLCANTPD